MSGRGRTMLHHITCINLSHKVFIMWRVRMDNEVLKRLLNTKKNAFQSKAHLPLADRKSNTYNLTFK